MKHKFVNAREIAEQHPDTFYVPDSKELAALKKGDYVKVCHNDERFWVMIDNNDPEHEVISGRVDNELVHWHPFKMGYMIDFQYCNVYQFMPIQQATPNTVKPHENESAV